MSRSIPRRKPGIHSAEKGKAAIKKRPRKSVATALAACQPQPFCGRIVSAVAIWAAAFRKK